LTRPRQLIRKIQQHIEEGENSLQCECSAPKFVTIALSLSAKEQDHIDGLELLKKASDDMGNLVDGVTKFANWWSKAKSMISTLEKQMFASDQRINPIRLEMARRDWECVRERYEVYTRTVSVLY